MEYDHTISGLLRKRDEMMGEMQAHREAMGALHNDIEAIDRVLGAMGYVGDLEARTGRPNRLVIFYRNELRQWLLRELRGGEALSSRDLAERICSAEGKDIHDKRMICDVTRRVSKALRLLRDRGVVVGEKDKGRRFVWRMDADFTRGLVDQE